VTDSSRKNSEPPIRRPSADRDAISAVKLSEGLTAEIDAWAEAHDMNRSDAIRQLVQLGLNASTSAVWHDSTRQDPIDIEGLAVRQIDQLLDPSLPTEERERRIRRLTEGPPEFADERIDLPKPKK
jgi:lipase chaperone LimK